MGRTDFSSFKSEEIDSFFLDLKRTEGFFSRVLGEAKVENYIMKKCQDIEEHKRRELAVDPSISEVSELKLDAEDAAVMFRERQSLLQKFYEKVISGELSLENYFDAIFIKYGYGSVGLLFFTRSGLPIEISDRSVFSWGHSKDAHGHVFLPTCRVLFDFLQNINPKNNVIAYSDEVIKDLEKYESKDFTDPDACIKELKNAKLMRYLGGIFSKEDSSSGVLFDFAGSIAGEATGYWSTVFVPFFINKSLISDVKFFKKNAVLKITGRDECLANNRTGKVFVNMGAISQLNLSGILDEKVVREKIKKFEENSKRSFGMVRYDCCKFSMKVFDLIDDRGIKVELGGTSIGKVLDLIESSREPGNIAYRQGNCHTVFNKKFILNYTEIGMGGWQGNDLVLKTKRGRTISYLTPELVAIICDQVEKDGSEEALAWALAARVYAM